MAAGRRGPTVAATREARPRTRNAGGRVPGQRRRRADPEDPDRLSDPHPRVEVEMRSHNFADPCFGLSNGSVDVAFVRPPLLMQDWLSVETLFVEPRVLVTSSNSPLAVREQVAVEDVLDEAFVARRAPDYWRDFWLAVSSRGAHPPKLGRRGRRRRRMLRGDPGRAWGGVHPGLDPALLRPAGTGFHPGHRPPALDARHCLAQRHGRAAGQGLRRDRTNARRPRPRPAGLRTQRRCRLADLGHRQLLTPGSGMHNGPPPCRPTLPRSARPGCRCVVTLVRRPSPAPQARAPGPRTR